MFSACVPSASAACRVTQKRYERERLKVGVSLAPKANGRDLTGTEVRSRMRRVLIGVDPHKASVTLAVVDEAIGELIERASFPQNLEKA